MLTDSGDNVAFDIPSGSVRLLVLKKLEPVTSSVLGIAWDGETEPALSIYGIEGEIVPGGQGIRAPASSTDGTFGGEYPGASVPVNGSYEIRGVEHSNSKSRIKVSVTNQTGA